MNKEKGSVNTFEYKAEMKQLLNIIVHSLYTHPEVFLRELISNACDALNKARFDKINGRMSDDGKELCVRITADDKKHTFSIEDNGVGMNKEELINNIGTVARSGTAEFLQKIKKDNKQFNEQLIGQFGVGFYSVFMVTDEVTIETCQGIEGAQGYRWTSKGENSFTIEEIDRKERGTKISFKLKTEHEEFSQEYRIKDIINKYSNFADFPIYLKDEKVNSVSALWYKSSDQIKKEEADEFYKFITNDTQEPLGFTHIALEGAVNFRALLFIPKDAPRDLWQMQREKSLSLYSKKILIQHDCKELLPEYLRFVKGVVDTEDIPLNVSRETVQTSSMMYKIGGSLTKNILRLLQDWADKDTQKYMEFYKNFSPLLKSGVGTDFENRSKIIDLMRFESSLKPAGEVVSFKDYAARMKTDQKEIYYFCGDSRAAVEQNPNLEYFKKKGIEVLYMIDPVDSFVVPSIGEYDKHPLKSAEKADIDLAAEDKIEKPDNSLSQSLLKLFKETLGDRVQDVVSSKRLVDSAVTLVTPATAMDAHSEKLMKMMNKDFHSSKRIMEVNLDHPLISNLSRMCMAQTDKAIITKCIEQLYEGALLLDDSLANRADFVRRMTDIMQAATK